MKNFLKSFFYNKSRFYFNISFIHLLNKIAKYIINRQVDYKNILTKKLQKYFKDPNIFFLIMVEVDFIFYLCILKINLKGKF